MCHSRFSPVLFDALGDQRMVGGGVCAQGTQILGLESFALMQTAHLRNSQEKEGIIDGNNWGWSGW
jgi:hypothetical protein